MKTIYKYGPFAAGCRTQIQMPDQARIRHVGTQNHGVFLWAEVDTEATLVHAEFFVIDTGWDLADCPDGMEYVGTTFADLLVWHLYAVKP